MFENKTEKEARNEILTAVKAYSQIFHQKKEYKNGDRIPYAGRIYDSAEIINLVNASLEFWLTSGHYSDEFEHKLSEFLGIPYCALVNSGSSANLLAFISLTSPELGEKRINKGDEVITVAAGFPTTVTPIIQYGAIPVFVDITIPEYNIDISKLEDAYSERTKAVVLAHTLGNPFNIKAVKEFCDKYDLWLIEDNCDALGSKYTLNGICSYTGTFGDIATSSFYPPHHITMGEGGAVYTKNPLLYKLIRSYRDWGRDCVCASGQDDFCKHRFSKKYGELPFGYDHKYVYSHFGYNLKATDMQAAIGCAQLNKLNDFINKRKENHERLYKRLLNAEDKLVLPLATENSEPSWFGFLITCKSSENKNRVVEFLEQNDVQTRMLFAGNLIKQPCFDEMRQQNKGYRVVGDLKNTDIVMNNTFWIGVYPGMTMEMIDKMADIIVDALKC